MLRIHLFGQLHLRYQDAPLPFKAPPRTGPLLACLLLNRGGTLRRDTVAALLWPDADPKEGRTNLRRHLHYLKQALPIGGSWLLSEAQRIGWNPQGRYWLDVAAYEQVRSDPGRLAEAVALYGSDLLEGLPDEWLLYERERLRSLFLTDLSELIRERSSQRDFAGAIGYAQRLLASEPLREDVVRQLMSLRYQAGDRAGAIATFESFENLVRTDLGVEPMPDTAALYRRLVRNEAVVPTAEISAGDPAAAKPTPDLPFVGRDEELGRLEAGWRTAAGGRGAVTLVGGEAGIGKTRLVSELARSAEEQGGRLLWGNTSFPEARPYQAAVDALQSALPLLAALEVQPMWLAAVAALLPTLRNRRPDLPPLPPLDPEGERFRLFDGVARCLEQLAATRPLLMVLEDLHWADEASVALLEFLAGRVGDHPILILGTYREEAGPTHPLRRLRRRLQSTQSLNHLALSPLSRDAVETLCDQLTSTKPEVENAGARLHAASEGNPLILGELVQSYGRQDGDGGGLPQSVQAVVQTRLSRLHEGARSLLEAAAVVGADFSLEVLRELLSWREGDVLDGLDALLEQHLVQESGRRSGMDFRFRHHLIQEVVYAEVPEGTKVRRHRRIAFLLEALHSDQRDQHLTSLATHFDRAGEAERAASYYLESAKRSLALFAHSEAQASLDRGLELASDPNSRSDLLLTREGVSRMRGERRAQLRDLEALEQLVALLADGRLRCRWLLRSVHYRRALGEREAEQDLIAQLREAAAGLGDETWQARALEELGHHQALLGHFDEAIETARQTLATYQQLGDIAGEARSLLLETNAAVSLGNLERSATLLDLLEALPQAELDQGLLFECLRAANMAAMTRQDFTTANGLAQRMVDHSLRSGDRKGEADAHMHHATSDTRLSNFDEARDHYRLAEAIYSQLGHRQGEAAVQINRGILDLSTGRYAEAAQELQDAERRFEALSDLRGQAIAALNASVALLFRPDYPDAKAVAVRALALSRRLGSDVLEAASLGNLGDAERNLGELNDAIEHLSGSVGLNRRLGRTTELASSLCELGLALLATGRLEQARAVAEELLDLSWDDNSILTYPQYNLWVAARVMAEQGDHERAATLLAEAHSTLQQEVADVPDRTSQEGYLGLAFNRDIIQAFKTPGWPNPDS